uniref:hypothetical protein n=1 Tax=Mucilaginibacter sp. TaxID=1882438 RepID=UPI0025E7B219
ELIERVDNHIRVMRLRFKPSRFAKIFLERGKRYKIEANHRENVGGQQARLEYEVPSAGINGRRIVPKSQLFPAQ